MFPRNCRSRITSVRFAVTSRSRRRIAHASVLIVNSLLRYESDVSPLALAEWNGTLESRLRFERKVSGMACNNIAQNVNRLVQNPKTLTVHLSELPEAARYFKPDAIVMSGTYADFDYYNPAHLEKFREVHQGHKIPVLAICGSHQLVGWSFGAELKTLDDLELSAKTLRPRSGVPVPFRQDSRSVRPDLRRHHRRRLRDLAGLHDRGRHPARLAKPRRPGRRRPRWL